MFLAKDHNPPPEIWGFPGDSCVSSNGTTHSFSKKYTAVENHLCRTIHENVFWKFFFGIETERIRTGLPVISYPLPHVTVIEIRRINC